MSHSSSKYIQITPYILIEYMYTSQIQPEEHILSFIKIENKYTGTNQILNVDSAVEITGSVRERSAVMIDKTKYADLDKDDVPDYLTYDSNLFATIIPSISVPYDTVRFHMLAGYNLEGLDGIVLKVEANERSGKRLTLGSLAFMKNSDYHIFNAKPIFLGDRLYDKYIEVKIPSIKLVNDIYYSLEGNPTQDQTFAHKITTDGNAFQKANPLYVSVSEVISSDVLSTTSANYDMYTIGHTREVSINQIDEFAELTAVIKKSEAGDYYEYFASWSGGFIEDFIAAANRFPENNYVVLHEVRVFEQIGSLIIQTGNYSSIQDSDFGNPLELRPIIKNAANAVSFTLDYIVRLYNKADSTQIIRTSSYTDYDAKMWGKKLNTLKLLYGPESQRIYNKVVDGPTIHTQISAQGVNAASNMMSTRYVPSFFDRTTISVSQDSVYVDNNGNIVSEISDVTSVIYGQGDANIVINPFDNFFKFTVTTTSGKRPAPIDLNMNAEYYMVFIDNNGKKVRFPHTTEQNVGRLSSGDLVFKVPSDSASKIIAYDNKEFYIVTKTANNTETSLYQGVFNKPQDINKAKMANESVKAAASAKTLETIRRIEIKQDEAKLQSETQSGSVSTSRNSTSTINPSDIPGMSSDVPTSMSSIVAAIKPKKK
jgi:hypothetical protein